MLPNKPSMSDISKPDIDQKIEYIDKQCAKKDHYLKKVFDRVFSFACLILLFPVFIIIAVLIKIDSKGPVFFRQKRCGKNGKEFYMYKFRTMLNDAEALKKILQNEMEGPVFKIRNDPRVTRIGKILRRSSLDEIPQFINVLKGEMSLVGPRPLAKEEMIGNNNWKNIRLTIQPGITGLWQIAGRSSGKFTDWVKYDMEYVQNRSLWLDMKILFCTVIAILSKKGAF